ncbi:MerR family transcriptional regulator [Phaeacidiphilus oryzae]|uniref:MerR family transcriptional regulator n=1 Tax=Phaeacidiphilus oryzae TaxID=348818 RepID=UPI00056313C1|nr:MerR family transcriptional regulator [Phaeacidiphilus oryzae]
MSAPEAVPTGEAVTIGEAARRTGVSVHTLRYYERTGLMAASPHRTSGGSRRYSAADLKWISMCTKLRATGMPIDLIRQYAELVRAGEGNEAERLELLESHREQVAAEIATLTENLGLIDHKIDTYRRRLAEGTAHGLWTTPRTP